MTVEELLAALAGGGDDAKEAAATLGLLIERAERGPDADDEDIRAALLPAYADRRLSEDELEAATNGLLDYLATAADPLPQAAWALSKSFDPRVETALIDVLERWVDDPQREDLAYQALVGMIPIGTDAVEAAVAVAAERGHGRVRETARGYLRLPD
jgi:hypothetical protein